MKIEHAYILYIDTPDAIKYMEECKKSCEEHSIPVTPFKGMKLPTTTKEIYDNWGFKVDPRVDGHEATNDVLNIWFKEQLCLTGHLSIWKKIASEHTGAVAVFEHDAIVKRNFLDADVQDNEWLFLGYRVDHRDDYECIDEPFTRVQIEKFEGTHAYAITPNIDPAPVIVPVEQKKSHTQPDDKTARYNMIPPNGFIKGLKNTDKYMIDEENGWIVF